MSFSQMMHNLAITRFLVAARRGAESAEGVRLCEARICYELGAVSVEMEEKGRKDKDRVVPDAWLLFEKLVKGKAPVEFPVRRPHQVRHLFDLVLTHLEWDTGHTLPRQQRAQPCASWGRTQKKRP